jgi:hypothetical protein
MYKKIIIVIIIHLFIGTNAYSQNKNDEIESDYTLYNENLIRIDFNNYYILKKYLNQNIEIIVEKEGNIKNINDDYYILQLPNKNSEICINKFILFEIANNMIISISFCVEYEDNIDENNIFEIFKNENRAIKESNIIADNDNNYIWINLLNGIITNVSILSHSDLSSIHVTYSRW